MESLTKEVYEFLDDLRESGVVNMYAAGEYIEDEFIMAPNLARKFLREWMESFGRPRPQNGKRS